MESHRQDLHDLPEKKGQKRKLEEEESGEGNAVADDKEISLPSVLLSEVKAQVAVLDAAFSWYEADRAAAKRATHVLSELAKNGNRFRRWILD